MAVAGDGTFLLVFNRAPRRPLILHPPQDPEFRNVLMRSTDEGRAWSAPVVVPDYHWAGVECAGLTFLRSGRLLLNQWKFEWLPLTKTLRPDVVRPDALIKNLAASPELDVFVPDGSPSHVARAFPWARGGGETVVHLSDDKGESFFASPRIDTRPFSGGYGMRGAIELPDGDILLPLSDVPRYRAVFVVRSRDGGESWSAPSLVAEGEAHEFEEPAGLLLPSGRILLMLRDNLMRVMHLVHSGDGGRTWSEPKPSGIRAYPAHLLALPDGRIACIAGQRTPPFGIVMHVSEDQGESWTETPIRLTEPLPSKDLGYPTAALRATGDLYVVYYAQGEDGVTGLHDLTVRLP
jgi:hypothetical protein